MIIEKLKVFIAKHKIVFSILFISFIVVCCLSIALSLYQKYYDDFSDTTKGIIGTLLGAFVGGSFSLMGSFWINGKTQKAKNAIKKKDSVFKPLYDELMFIHNEILIKNPYPDYIQFEEGVQTILKHPQYTVWGKIKNDTRLFETPKKLRKAMDKLYGDIHLYLKRREVAKAEVDRLYREEMKALFGISLDEETSVGNPLLSSLMTSDDSGRGFLALINSEPEENTDVDRIWNRLLERAKANETLQSYKESRELWCSQEQYVLSLLGAYIQYVVERYEG